MSDSDKRAVVQAWAEAISSGDLDAALTHLAPDFVGHFSSMPEPVRGPEAFKGMYEFFIRPAFPDQRITIEREVDPGGDRIALQVSWTATHTGPFLGVPPTGRTIHVPGTGIFRVADGKIAEEWMLEDFLGIYQQITQG
jgi:steroid delta-isomerase-like uncharacterized protein